MTETVEIERDLLEELIEGYEIYYIASNPNIVDSDDIQATIARARALLGKAEG